MGEVTTAPADGLTVADLNAMPSAGCRHELIDGLLYISPYDEPLGLGARNAQPDDGRRCELVDGTLVVSPSPSLRHQTAVGVLFHTMQAARPPSLKVVMAPFDVVMGNHTVLVPDLVVANPVDFTDRELPVAPLLTIEVLSRSTRLYDLTMKRSAYEDAGVTSYWVVDPIEPSLLAWDLVDGAYVEVANVRGDETWTATLPYPVTITPSALVAER